MNNTNLINNLEEKNLLTKIKNFISSMYYITEEAGEDIYSDLGKKGKIKLFNEFSSIFKKEIEEGKIEYSYDDYYDYTWCIASISFSSVSITLEGEVDDEELESLFINLKYVTVSINDSDIFINNNEKYNSVLEIISNILKNM